MLKELTFSSNLKKKYSRVAVLTPFGILRVKNTAFLYVRTRYTCKNAVVKNNNFKIL